MSEYIAYVLLDPRKHGLYVYDDLKFEFEPFYIGSGKKSRVDSHEYRVSLWKSKEIEGEWSHRPLYKLLKELDNTNLSPIKIVYETICKESSLDLEKSLIEKIGRKIVNAGPLVNERSGYQFIGPYLVLSPAGIMYYVPKGEIQKFSREFCTSYKTLIRSADRFENSKELSKGYLEGIGYGWSAIYCEDLGNIETANPVLKQIYIDKVKTVIPDFDFDEFISSKPKHHSETKRFQDAATAGKRKSEKFWEARRIGMKVCHEIRRKKNLDKTGFSTENEAKEKFISMLNTGYSKNQIVREFGCTIYWLNTVLKL